MLEEVQELRLYDYIKWLTSRFKESIKDMGEGPSQALYEEGVNTNEDDI